MKSHFIFDLDGTLIDSEPVLTHAINLVRSELSLPNIVAEDFKHLIGCGAERMLSDLLRLPSVQELELSVRRFRNILYELSDKNELYPGVKPYLEYLTKAGSTMDICTNKPRFLVESILNNIGISSIFRHLICGDDYSFKKPDERMLGYILQDGDSYKKGVIYIGDSAVDQTLCKRCGIDFAFHSSGYDDGVKPDECRLVFASYFDDSLRLL